MIFYTGIVMTPYDSRLGLITRVKKELEICHNCNTYQHMLTKKNEKSKRTTMCPKCRMVTIKLFSYPDLLLSTYEEDIVSTSITMTGEVKSKRNSCVPEDIRDNYIVIEALKFIKSHDFPTANEMSEHIEIGYDKMAYWLKRMVKEGIVEKHALPIEFKKNSRGSVYYSAVEEPKE